MALEHALLVSLAERAASGLELTRRFDASIGFFWQASHQQIYRTLKRMEADGWLSSEEIAQPKRPAKLVYDVTPVGHEELRRWLAEPTPPAPQRSDLAVKLRGAWLGDDREARLDDVAAHLADHVTRRDHYLRMCERDYPEPSALAGADLDHYLVLRGGILLEEYWVSWLSEYLAAFGRTGKGLPTR
ncbi:PadR family transcriptional regulator [Nocardioides daejeonensis]|uniref:PadR family transcriptional regulator n=1 Tax=Nocardioides daejeonensis TaxID=1046556 RepID=UPI000D74E6E6|nr:PadR family transcriptional regulator [Nocardioides daejeonensis]